MLCGDLGCVAGSGFTLQRVGLAVACQGADRLLASVQLEDGNGKAEAEEGGVEEVQRRLKFLGRPWSDCEQQVRALRGARLVGARPNKWFSSMKGQHLAAGLGAVSQTGRLHPPPTVACLTWA